MRVDHDTELRRLAQLLHQDKAELAYLESLDGEQLQGLRGWLQNRLLDEFELLFERIARSGRLLPNKLNAFICRKIFGPTLTANSAYYTPADRAAAMCRHLGADFMADIVRELIPERAADLLNDLPVELMRDVTRLLAESDEYYVMGAFTDVLSDDKVLVLMQEMDEPADLLRISSFAQRKDRIAELTTQFDDDTIRSLVEAAQNDEALIHETLLIVSEMSDADQQRMATLADEVDPGFRQAVGSMAERESLGEAVSSYVSA